MSVHLEEFLAAVSGAVIGGLLYCIATYRKGVSPSLHLVEAILSGYGLATGIHLMVCSVQPSHLVEVLNLDGSHLSTPVLISIGGIHRVEIFVGGMILAFVGGKSLYSLCARVGLAPHN